MRKFLSLLVALATVTMAWAAEGGTLTASATPINPTQDVTLSYDGTGTNFANWEPKCFIHSWLVAADGQTFSKSYSTDWASCNGDADYAALASKLKMTFVSKGKYTISMNIEDFFDVAEADLPKIGKLGVIVRAQYEGDNNKTNDMFLDVVYADPTATVTYTALTAAPTTGNWAGQYLIVFADNKAHATVSGSDLAATSDALTVTAGEIEINSTDAYYVTVEPYADGYSIKLPSNKYLSVNANSNKVAEVNNPYVFNFEYTASGIKIFGTDTKGNTRYILNNSTYYRGYLWNDSYKLPTLYRTGDEAPALQTLYCVNVLDWTKVNAFVWPATGDAYKGWPGEAMYKTADQVKGKDIYAYRFPATFVNAIFNNGTDQTVDLAWDATKPYFVPGAKNGEGKYEGTWYASKEEMEAKDSVYFVNVFGWENPKVYMWNSETDHIEWPGIAMTKLTDQINGFDVYKVVTDKDAYAYCLFDDGKSEGADQTADLTWTSEKYFYVDAWYDLADIPELPSASAIYSVGGSSEALFYQAWQVYHPYGYTKMTRQGDTWDYVWESDDVSLFTGDIAFKVYQDKDKDKCFPAGDKNDTIKVTIPSTYVVTITFNAVTKRIYVDMKRTSNIVLHQFDLMGSWSTPAFGVPAAFQFNESDPVSLVHLNLKAGEYEFKLKEGDTWFGDGQEFYRDYPQHYDVLDRNDKNMKLHADVDGEYLFIFNFKLNELKVAYPAVVPAKKIAALNGAFTINAAGDKINFSRGNLQYNYGASQWYCATEQYEMLGYSNLRFGDDEYKGSVDMFSWSCESSNFGLHKLNKDADYYGDFVDWGTKFAATEGWRTLTKAEWQYILGRGDKAWTMAAIGRDSIVGLLLFPDGWTAPTGITISYKFYDLDDNAGLKSNTFSLEQWDKLEAAGAVFLPLAGSRAGAVGNQWNGASETTAKNPVTGWYCWMSNVNLMGYYWFSTVSGSNADYTMIPGVNGDWTKYTPPIAPAREKRRGNSVRLVAPATPPAKYYVTGDSALVVDAGYEKELAWNADAIKAAADTTVLNLKAGVEYKLKVTVDGTWDTALGYDNLSKKAEGLSADGDGNICFKLAEAGAVKVVYFKTGDVVTYELIGNFYIKPVIVETLNLVPNMWSEADAKMAAWVWGEGLAGAWTPFFAGEGDTLSVKIDEQADSVIFVRFANEVAAPAWDATIWNRVKDEEIDHVGLTYTITAWGDEGVSVGQWTPYEPVVPGKYYITGDSALVVDAGLTADKAWNADAIKADADTTVLNLKAGVEYKLKVTVDGTWDTALGFDALSEKTEGLIADADGNICFKLAEAGAVQVVYFKEGDVVTFKVLGNFYIKPVIVETLKLVPNMWSEAGAKMAAWVWGEGLAGAWTPFFAGEGDTLSVKIDEQADSVIFVRFANEVAAPAWEATIWNRVKDEEIDHVGLTYTITAWGDEGVSVGQWTPYEPVVPGKYYITGDSALVVDAGLTADKAWNADAIKADADTTVLNLKAGVDYKLKVTIDGTWNTALGYDALSEKAEGLIKDADDNICFKLTEAGAVQVVYFKEGDVVTFKVLGNFYIKPVIVETLNLVPNMWSEAGAKMAAWVWGEGLAGAWTPFFAGEGDTLSVKIDEQADSIIFVRFANEVAAPAWEATIWNRVKDEEIDHVGLTYTITAWGDEGISVGQWTPYKPAGCDWDNLPWLGSADAAYAEQFKVCVGDPKPTEVVNIQKPGFATEIGIYITFPSAAFTSFSLPESAYDIQGAGVIFHLSAFTARETEVTVVCESKDYIFTVFNKKGGEPVVPGKYYMKNNWNAGTEWTWLEMTPDNSGLYKLDNVVFGGTGVNYNTEEVDATATWVPVDQFLGDKIGAKDTVNFTLNPVAGTVTATLVGKYIPSGDAKYYMKNNWNAGSDWTWKEMTPDNSGLYKLDNVVFGGTGVNYNTEEVDATASWVPVDQFLGDKIGAKDTVNFTLDPVAGTVTATLLGKYVDPTPGEKVYTIVGVAALVGVEWNPEATENDMAKQADGSYKLVKENVVLEAKGYDYKVIEGHAWGGWELPTGGANQTLTITAAGTYNVTFVLSADLATLTATATNVGPTPDPVVEVWGNMNDWSYGMPMTLSADKTKATISANIDPDTYEFKIMVNGEWRSNAQTFTRQNNSAVGITMNEDANMIFVADVKGDYTVTWTLANSALSIVYPASTAIENLVAPANELRKVMIDGKLYILREGKIYSVQGQLIR